MPSNGRTSQIVGMESATENIPLLNEVRVKRCGKSTPALLVTMSAWKTPPGARLSRDDTVAKLKAVFG